MSNPIKTTAALIIDVENMIGGIIKNDLDSVGQDSDKALRYSHFDIGLVCDAVIQMYGSLHFRISIGDIFYSCKRTNFMDLIFLLKKNFHDNLIDVHEVTNFDNVKDRTDFFIYTETLDLAYREESIDSFAVISMDKGFIPLYMKLKQLGKKVTVIGMSESAASGSICRVADSVIFYDELVRRNKAPHRAASEDPPDNDEPQQGAITLVGRGHLADAPEPKDYSDIVKPDDYTLPHGGGAVRGDGVMGVHAYQSDAPQVRAVSLEKPEPVPEPEPEPPLPEWVNFDNYLAALDIRKCVNYVLNCPTLTRDHYAGMCQMVEALFNEALNSNNSKIKLVWLSDLLTNKILAGEGPITPADLQEYFTDPVNFSMISQITYKVIRTLYMADVFTRVPNETNKCNDPFLLGFAEPMPELLVRIFSAVFGFLRYKATPSIPLQPEALAMAFYRRPSESSKREMEDFIQRTGFSGRSFKLLK
jgi:uncharacterized LabA/DUF88 family protein